MAVVVFGSVVPEFKDVGCRGRAKKSAIPRFGDAMEDLALAGAALRGFFAAGCVIGRGSRVPHSSHTRASSFSHSSVHPGHERAGISDWLLRGNRLSRQGFFV